MSEATPAAPTDSVTLTVDGRAVTVKKGTNVLEAARTLGVDISAFCYHPGLSVVAQCRQCLCAVESSCGNKKNSRATCNTCGFISTTVRSDSGT